MILYLMRHGEAVSAGIWRDGDKTRPLAPHGENQLKAAVPEWARVRFQPKTLITSPLTRAQQTAAYVCQANPELQPITLPELASGVKPDGIRNALLQADWMWPLLYVGHMPDLALFSSRITHDPALMETMVEPGETLAFETGAWQTGWGTGQLLWRRKIDEWKKAKEL